MATASAGTGQVEWRLSETGFEAPAIPVYSNAGAMEVGHIVGGSKGRRETKWETDRG